MLPVKAVLGSCSELNIITTRCCNKLKLRGTPTIISVTGAGGHVTLARSKIVEVMIVDTFGVKTSLECVVFDKACGRSLKIDGEIIEKCKLKYKLDEKDIVSEGGDIDILVGMPKPALHRQFSMEVIDGDMAIWSTRFGKCIVGTAPRPGMGNYEASPFTVSSACIVSEDATEDKPSFREILECELAGINREPMWAKRTVEDIQFDEKMKTGLTQDEDGRLKVDMPWNCDPDKTLENNRLQAVQSDMLLMKQLKKDPIVSKLFQEVKEGMIKEGIWQQVDADYPKRYLPLVVVVDLEKETSKVRVCLDAKRKFKGMSLNDALLKGSVDMVDIFEAITKARSGTYVLIGDMKKMFWQVKMSEDDQRFHGIMCGGETYVFTRVCYGDKPSPAIADYSMKKIVEWGRTDYPKGSDVIENKRYVDDLQDAHSNIDELCVRRNEVDQLLKRFGFEIKEWRSNSPDLGTVKEKVKVLGVLYIPEKDVLIVTIPKEIRLKFSKGVVLSVVNGVWDPIGILIGLLITGKLIFQAIVRMKVGWDDDIDDEELLKQWRKWLYELNECTDVEIDRSLLPRSISNASSCILVGFSDGSSVAHGCTLYLRWADAEEKNVEVKFIGAKGKVNPIKGTTTPRAEMCGAFLLSRLTHSAEKAFKDTELSNKIQEKVLFTDSTTALSWTKSGAVKYKPYVRNKIVEMQELHPIRCWQYVPRGKNTAADLVSKGCGKRGLMEIISGPELLKLPREKWNFAPMKRNKEEEDLEKLPHVLSAGPASVEDDDLPIDINCYSSWKKLVRVTAYVMKFGSKDRVDAAEEREEIITDLSEADISKAETYWVKVAQKTLAEDKISNLVPFVDENGVRRANGRLKASKLFKFEQKHPILLPKNHKVSELIVQQVHKDVYHPGYSRVVAEVRKKYWMVGLRSMARKIGKDCIVCRRWRGTAFEQMMSDLPDCRTSTGHPFEKTAIDYFGHFYIKVGYRGRRKAFGAIFTCLTTRAVHVELVTDLTTQCFLLALTRVISLYGKPKEMRSDNGRNFVGAASEIRTMLSRWRNDAIERKQIKEFCSENSFKWVFSTPLASHHNGCVESMVKSVKSTLNKIVKTNILNEEQYRTVFAQVTNCINSRPLWPSSDDNLDRPITCNDLLRPSGLPRDPEFMNYVPNPRTRYQLIQTIVNEWWQLWMSNFAPNLQPRSKWFKTRENVETGDIVLLIDKNVARSQWCMGVILDTYPGIDGLVRSVKVKTTTGTYDRPISKLCLLLSKKEQLEL